MKKSLILGIVLSLSTLVFAGAKSFTVVFDKAITVGSVKLAAGEYKVKVDGSNAVFTDTKSKSVSTAVKVENVDKKFSVTAVDSVKNGAVESVNAINIGGTTTKLEFAKQPAATN